jgi:energy-converting hydrogenase Eha subunit F
MVVEWMLRKRLVLRALIQVTQAIVPQTQGGVPLGVLPKLLKSQYPSTFTI